jgi:hypothetical protein
MYRYIVPGIVLYTADSRMFVSLTLSAPERPSAGTGKWLMTSKNVLFLTKEFGKPIVTTRSVVLKHDRVPQTLQLQTQEIQVA